MARREPEYKFVLAEVDYLKPYWDTHPQDRADLRRLIAEGRVEVMGGTYNEPNTNLTSPETAIRNFVHGIGFQRDVMGADPATAWQLDVFGHDPQFPGMAADAGLTSSSWARGPHHQWGPMAGDGDPERMQFASEFEWMAPSGRGLLTHYMPAHYAAGWWMDSSPSLAEAEAATYELFARLKRVALTRNVLLPVGTDYTPPNKWVTDIHRDWNARYTWPRFVCALPREFFAAVRAELDERGGAPSPQTRDMNPIYTGKDVSYIDTKQANRAAEHAVLEAERFAVFAGPARRRHVSPCRTGQGVGAAGLRRAPRRHHRLGVRPGVPRPADGLARRVGAGPRPPATTRWRSCRAPSTAGRWCGTRWRTIAPTSSPSTSTSRSRGTVVDHDGNEVPVAGRARRTLGQLAGPRRAVAGLAGLPARRRRSGRLEAVRRQRDRQRDTTGCGVDPARGGGVVSLTAAGRELIADGRVGNELAVYDEYPAHPDAGEGPWHLLPKGPVVCSSDHARRRTGASQRAGRAAHRHRSTSRVCCATPRP